MFNASNLHESLKQLGIAQPGDLYTQLSQAYNEPTRHYHDASHVSICLTHFSTYRSLARRPAEIEVAIWFHDAIYDTHQQDNEQQSANWARRYLTEHDVDDAIVDRIDAMIIATQSHQTNDDDAALMLDIDLGVLGASPTAFEAYDQAIRREYHWVPVDQYRAGRANVLRSFLDREQIYQTETLGNLLESQARINLTSKIAELQS